jgi:very-short-patch-repair endonuclease
MEAWERGFVAVAARHEGLIARFHLPEIGVDAHHWQRALASGRWDELSRRVLRSASSPASDGQRVLAAVLDASPGAVLHGPSALAWMKLQGFDLARVQVARQRGATGRAAHLAVVHRLRSLRAHDVIVFQGIPTETALRAIWTEAAQYASPRRRELGVERIGHLLDAAHREGLVTWAGLHEMVEDIRQRGRSGTVIMRELAGPREPGSSPTESRNETRFTEILEQRNIRAFLRQRHLGGHEPIGRCDFRDDVLPLALEVNSLKYHTTPTDRAADERRYQALNDAGFSVAVIWDYDLWARPVAVVATVHDARRRAKAGERSVTHSPACPWPNPYLGARS